jgi:hypothetical protein
MLAAARAYAAEGRPVFRLSPRTKLPMKGSHAYLDATTDEAQIRAWWTETPNANIATACGEWVCVDVDTKGDKHGDRELVRLVRENGPIGWTRQTTTPSGGYQFHFRAPAGVRIARVVGYLDEHEVLHGLAHGIDLLGYGGYTILPPSVTPKGAYRWQEDGAPVAELSGWLLERAIALSAPQKSPPSAEPIRDARPRWTDDVRARADRAISYVSKMPVAVEGSGGSDACLAVALVLVRGFDLPRSISKVILADYSRRCSPPWSDRELDHKLDSAERASKVGRGYLLEARHG